MTATLSAIELQGTVTEQHQICFDEPLPIEALQRVRVIVLYAAEGGEIGENDWRQAAANNEAFAFLNEPTEDIYTLTDGKPLVFTESSELTLCS